MSDKIDLSKLKEPFREDEYEWRTQSCGIKNGRGWAMVLCYVTNRAIMDRLDDVCGMDGWQNEFKPITNGMMCGLSIKVGDQWITKWDGSQNTDIEATKGGISKAMVRSASQWGIGRHLYRLESNFADQVSTEKQNGWKMSETKQKERIWWLPPKLPDWAVSERSTKTPAKAKPKPAKDVTDPPPPVNKNGFRSLLAAKATEDGVSDADMKKYATVIVGDMIEKSELSMNRNNVNDAGWPLLARDIKDLNLKEKVSACRLCEK